MFLWGERGGKKEKKNRDRPRDIENKFIMTEGIGGDRDKLGGWD